MKKQVMLVFLMFALIHSVFAIQQTFTGTVSNSADGDLVLARVEGNNFITEVASNRYRITVEGNEGSEVEFWMKDHIIHRERLSVGVKPVDLDAATITPKPLPPETDKPGVITPPQDKLPASEKRFVSYFWIILFMLLLAAIGGAVFYLQKNNWQLPFELPKFSLSRGKRPEIKIPPRKEPLIPPRIPPKIPPRIPTIPLKEGIKIPENFEKPQELTPPKANGAASALKDYVSSMKEKGFDVKQIKAALYARGWKKDLIEETIS